MRLLYLGFVISLGLSSVSLAQPKVGEKDQELNQIKQRIEKLEGALQEAQSERKKVRSLLREAETAISTSHKKIRQLNQHIDDKRDELQQLQQQQQDYQQKRESQNDALLRQLRSAYIAGRQEYIKFLLNQEDPNTLGRMLTYYNYLNQARLGQLNAITDNLAKLADVEQAIAQQTAQLNHLKQRQQAHHQALEATHDARSLVVAKLDTQIRSDDQRLKELRADAKELETLVGRLRNALSKLPTDLSQHVAFDQRRGKLPLPTQGRLRKTYGQRKQQGRLTWNGVIIDTPSGKDVHAVHRGRVAFADWLRGFGLLVILDHGDGYMSLYGYNQTLLKQTGDWVETNDIIASTGNSGGQANSGLYFELRHNGQPINPVKWLKRT